MLSLLFPLVLVAAPEVVAHVGSAAVTLDQVRERQAATRAAGGAAEPAGIVEDLVNEELLAEEAVREGLAKAPAVVAAADAERRQRAAQRLVEKELAVAGLIDDAQLRAMYHETGDSVSLKLIIVASEDEAKALRGRLDKGADFATEAKSSLEARSAAAGGDLGTATRGSLEPALQTVAFSAPLGALQGPVKLQLGWGVLKVGSRDVADEAGFSARKDAIRGFAEKQLGIELKAHYVRQLHAKYKVVLDEAFLQASGSAISASAEQASHPVATVGTRSVTYGDVLRQLVATFGGKQSSHFSGPTVKRELANEQVDRLLLETAALDGGYAKDAALEAQVQKVEREALVRELARRLREGVAAPTPAELEAFYREHPADFLKPARRTCAHLAVKTKEQAEQLRQRAAKGEAFEELAREDSIDFQTAGKGGLLGEVDDAQLTELSRTEPALAAAMRRAVPGKLSEPVQARSAWHLVSCGATVPASPTPFVQVKSALAQRLINERGLAAVKARVAELRAKANVTVDPRLLAALR